MKKIMALTVVMLLLIVAFFPNIAKASTTTTLQYVDFTQTRIDLPDLVIGNVDPPYIAFAVKPDTDNVFVKFDLSSIPAEASIIQAKLTIGPRADAMFEYPDGAGNPQIGIYRANGFWSSSTTCWNNQPTSLAAPTDVNEMLSWADNSFDVTSDVQSFVSGATNHGWVLKAITGVVFYFNPEYWGSYWNPTLEIEYVLPPVAAFSVSSHSKPVNENLFFDASSSYDPNQGESIVKLEWDWDSDGTYDYTSASFLATHFYSTQGDYTITLRVTSSTGLTDTCTDTVTITSGPQYYPQALFTPNTYFVPLNAPVNFDPAGSNDFDGEIVLYEWDWTSDGTYDESYTEPAIVGHAYGQLVDPTDLTVTITLRVTDNDGLTDIHSETVTLAVYLVPTIESCDSTGTNKDTFSMGETIYAHGTGYAPDTQYTVRVTQDVDWVDGMDLPLSVSAAVVTSDALGNLPPTAVYTSPSPGKYDIIVNVDDGGPYDAYADALDNNDVVTTAGLLVVPEYSLGALLALAACFAAFLIKKPR